MEIDRPDEWGRSEERSWAVRRAERIVEAVRDQRSRKCEQEGHHHVCGSDSRFGSDLFCYSSGRRCRERPEGGQKNHWSGQNVGGCWNYYGVGPDVGRGDV